MGELEVRYNIRSEFCQRQDDCPVKKILQGVKQQKIEGQLSLESVKKLSLEYGLAPRSDWYGAVVCYKNLHGYLDSVSEIIFVADCTDGLTADIAVTGAVVSCGSILAQAKSYTPRDRIEESVVIAITSSWVIENKVNFH